MSQPSRGASSCDEGPRGQTMIRAARRASLLVAFYLLTSTATAYTECAWELWHGEHIGSFETTPLMAMGAWSDRKDCEMVQEAKLKQLASDPYSSSMPRDPGIYDKIETLGNGVSVERYRKAQASVLRLWSIATSASPTPWTREGRRGSDAMSLWESARDFVAGIIKRFYFWLPAVLLDPFDVY